MSQQNQNKTDQKQHEWYAHVASSPSVSASSPATSMGRSNNGIIHSYESLYGSNRVEEGAGSSSCVDSGVGEGDNGGGCIYDLELRDGPNCVAYAHNQLLQYQQHQSIQMSPHIPLGAAATHLYDVSRKENNLQQQMNQYQQTLQNPLASRSLIEVEELIIKSEPPDEHILKSNFIEDTTPFVDFNDEMLNPKIELTIKEETPTDNQQKGLNFPRRKVQTERSETLPICQRCKQVFFKKQVYVSHVAESSCDIVEYDFKCSICPMSFMCMEELEKHKHLHSANKFFCHKFCGKYYNTITDCETHEYIHHEYETFVCNICSGTFPTREQLYAHLPLHKFQQRFDCSVCRLWFETPQELHRHRIGAPYFCGKYYELSPMVSNTQVSNFQNPMMPKPNIQQHGSYKLQDCRMGVMEIPPHQFQPSSSVANATVTSNFTSQRSFYQQNLNFNSNNSYFQVPPIKTEVKVESDFYLKSIDYQQQQMTSQNFSDYTNDSFSSSHNSSSFANDYSEAGSASIIAQQTQLSNASALDDSEDAMCCVPHCGVRKSTSPTLQFFTFPKDDKYLHQWLSNLKMLHVPAFTYLNYRICSLHFPKRCINRYSLCYWAVPTFNLGHDDVANLYQNRELTNTFTIGDVARCSMPNCKSQRGESNVKFYNFPKDIKSLIKWCQNARLPVQAKEPRHFCGRHFEERCIGKFRLKPWAVPTLNLGTPFGKIHDNPQNLYVEEKRCCLPFCRRSRSSDFNMSLYRFPRDEVLLQRWCYNLRLDPAVYRGKNHKICSAHFIKEALGLRKLSPGAVPTLNLGHNDTFNVYENELYTPPPPPQLQKGYYRQNNSLPMPSSSASSNSFSSMFYGAESSSPFSSVTHASSTPNITESMDVCCVPGCESKRKNSTDITFHTIPRRPEQMQKWCHNLKMEEDKMHKGLRICSLHFESYCIGGCMRPFAVPTLNLGHNDDNIYKNPDVIKKLNIRETCCVQICKRNRERDHANLHRFPSNPVMMKKWCDNLHKPVPDGSRLFNDAICEVHFEDRCLRNKRLEKWSVPTLNLGHDDLVHQLPTEVEVAELYARPSAPNNGDEDGECCVESCRRNPQVDDIKLYRTPEDPDKLAKWAHNLQIETEELSLLRICNLHFESHCIGKRMHSWAIPTLNLGTNIENLFENPEQPLLIKKERSVKFNSSIHSVKPTWVPRCCLPHCRKMRSVHNVHLFRFPSINRAMLAKWCHNLQVPLVGSAQRRVCSAHFNPDVLSKKCPIPHSVPTLDLNTPPGYKIYQNPARLKASKICMQRICIIDSCRKKRSDGVILFRFPNNHSVLRKWLHNIKQRPKGIMRAQCRICSSHFEPHSFHGKRLSNGAIPTLKLGHTDDDIYPNEARSFVDEQCIIQGCGSIKEIPEVRLFKFPTDDEDHLWKWCNNLKMNPIDCRGVRICNKHFEPECIGPKHLYKWSIPTLALGHDDTEIELIQNPKPEDRYAEIIFKCCVPTCGKTRKYDEVQMNSFPKDPKQFRRWKHNLKLEYLDFKERDKYKICNAHFEDVCIGKTRLNIGSIPTLNLGHNDTNLYNVKPEKLHRNLFGKHRPVLDSATSEDSDQYEEDTSGDKKEEVADYDLSDDINEAEKLLEDDPLVESSNLNLTHAKMKSSLDMLKCCVLSCRKSRLQHGIRLYSFPSGPIQLKKWSHNIQLSPTTQKKHLKICNLHFHKRCIDSKQLRPWAVPTMLLGHSEPIYENPKNIPGFFLPVCALEHCRKRRTIDNDLRTYQFPKGLLLKKWCSNLRLQPEVCRGRICAEHFEAEVRGKLKLKTGAVPTQNLGHDDMLLYDNENIKTVLKKNYDNYEVQSQISRDEAEHDSTTEADDDEDEFCDPLKFVETIDEHVEQSLDTKSHMETTVRKEKPPNNVTPICCLKHCRKEKTAQHHLSTFGFPKNQELLYKWCVNLKLNPDDCVGRVCIEHFDPEVVGSRKLKQGAVPTINVGHDEPLRYSNNGLEMSFELIGNEMLETSKDIESSNLESHYAQKLSHSVFRLCSLKHCRKRKMSELSDKTNCELRDNFTPPKENSLNSSYLLCCVKNCGKSHLEEGVRLNRFPKKRIHYLKWAYNLQLKSSPFIVNSYKVCSEHFESYCLKNGYLKEGAVPTLKLGYANFMIYHNPKKLRGRICVKEKKCFVPNCLSIYLNISKTYPLPTSKEMRLLLCNYFNVENNSDDSTTNVCGLHFLHLYENATILKFMKSSEKYKLKEKYKEISNSASVQRLKCSVPGCQTKYIDNVPLTKLPRNVELCKKWLHNTKLIYNEHRSNMYRICLLHFEKDCIAYGRPKFWAIPTLHFNHNEHLFLNPNESNVKKLFMDGNSSVSSTTGIEKELSDTEIQIKSKPINEVEQKTESPKRIQKTCCIAECNNQADQMQLFQFPTTEYQLQKWCVNTNQHIARVRNLYVCAKHFEPEGICKHQLRPWALPTLFLAHDNFVIQNAKHLGNFHSEEQESEDMKYIRSNYCSVLCCFQKQNNPVRLYPYPSDMALIRKWAANCKHRSFQASKYGFKVCQDHFDDKCFERNGDLREGAVPTLNLGFSDGQHILQSEWVETKRKASTPTLLRIKCAAPHCESISGEGMPFFKFPKTSNLLELWCKNLKLTEWNENTNMHLCQLHFEKNCFTNNQRLHNGTLPTLLLGHNQTEDIVTNPDSFDRFEVTPECCVPQCGTTKQDDKINVQLCSFPRFRSLFYKWAHNLKVPPNNFIWQSGKVCIKHFEPFCHENGRLKSGAMPTLHLGHNDPNIHHTNELILGKRRKPQHFIRTGTPTLAKMDFKCCFPACKEHSHPRMKQEIDLPGFEPLRRQWCNLMGCDPQDTELKLCPLHYIINFEVTYDEFKSLQLQMDSENSLQSSLAELEDTYYLAKCNTRVLTLSCVVPRCLSLLPRDNYKLYPLPHNQDLLEKWLDNIQIEVDESRRHAIRVCSQHFKSRCLQEPSKRLKVWAVPTLNLPELSEDKTLHENPTDEVLDRNNLKCCIRFCENSEDGIDVTIPLYSYPHESDILKKWIYNTQTKARDTFGSRVCALHFEKNCIAKRLRKWAVPTINLGHNLTDIFQNPSNKRLSKLKFETTAVESEESRMSYLSDLKTETMDSSNLEPIVKMECLELCGTDDQSIYSQFSYEDQNNLFHNEEDITSGSRCDSIDPAQMSLEVMLEVGHVEKCTTYEQHMIQTNIPVTEQSLPSPSERNANARRCCITGCTARHKDVGIKLHKFPQSKIVLKKWMHNAQVEVDLRCPWRYRICSRHFESGCFNGHRFRYGTMPTLHLGPKQPAEIYENEFETQIVPQRRDKDLTRYSSDNDEINEVENDDSHSENEININKSGKYCQIEGCQNHLHTDGVTLHKFPQLTRLWKKWQHNTQIPIDINYPWRFRVCSEHFHPQCLPNSRLLFGSVPTLNLSPNAPQELYDNEFQINSPLKVEKFEESESFDNFEEDYDVTMTIEPEIELNLNEESTEARAYDDYDYDNVNDNLLNTGDNYTKAAMGRCCIPGCNMNKATPGITLHKYPNPPEHLRKWLHNTQVNVDLTCRWRYRVCSLHFEKRCFRGPRIIYGCVPTLNLGSNVPDFIYENDEVFRRLETENLTLNNVANEKPKHSFCITSFNKLRCSVSDCARFSGQDGVSLHRLPQDGTIREKWLVHCTTERSVYHNNLYPLRICSRHFERSCFIGPPGKRYLKPGVIPTLHLRRSINNEFKKIVIKDEESTISKSLERAHDISFIYNDIKSGYGKCSLIHCQKQKSQHGVKIYKFPKSLQQQQRWTHNLRISYDPIRPWKYLICSEHFEEKCVSKRKLYKWAVPTLNLGSNIPNILYTNEQCRQLYIANDSSSDGSGNEDKCEVAKTQISINNNFQNLAAETVLDPLADSKHLHSLPTKCFFAYKTKICCLPHCRKPRGDGIKLFRLPTSVLLIRKWEHNTGISFNESQRNTKLICSKHFPPSLIGIRRLSKNAVPTLNLGPSAPLNLHTNNTLEDEMDEDGNESSNLTGIENEQSSVLGNYTKLLQQISSSFPLEMVKQDHDDWPKNNDVRLPPKNMTYKQHHCCVPHCGVARKGNLKLFRVPIDPILRAKWELNLCMKFDINDRNINLVCSRHFEPELVGATRLARGAVPTLSLKPIKSTQSIQQPDLCKEDCFDLIFCNVPGCNLTNAHKDIIMFNSHMRELEVLRKWSDALQIDVDNPTINEGGFNICSTHFEQQCFASPCSLYKWAVPTIRLGQDHNARQSLSVLNVFKEQCCVPNCHSTGDKNIQMFSFPTDELLLRKWCTALRIGDENNYRYAKICSAHFQANNYDGLGLKFGAIPSLSISSSNQKDCVVQNCLSNDKLNSFPENRNTCAKWCHNLKIDQLSKLHMHENYHVCDRHFETCCTVQGNLHFNAVPTLNLGHDDPNIFLNENLSDLDNYTQNHLQTIKNDCEIVVKQEHFDFDELNKSAWHQQNWDLSNDPII